MTEAELARHMHMLRRFTEVYCRHHHDATDTPCTECDELLRYAEGKLRKCPFDPKPKCKDCKVHCYAAPQRTQMKQIMKFSGMHFVKRGRVDWLVKYFLT